MKASKKLLISALFLIILNACGPRSGMESKQNFDYSTYQEKGILTGRLTDGNSFYLTIENKTDNQISGRFLVDDNSALQKTHLYHTDSFGNTKLNIDQSIYSAILKEEKGIKYLVLPEIKELNIPKQSIPLNYKQGSNDNLYFQERYKNHLFQDIQTHFDVEYGKANGFYTSRPTHSSETESQEGIYKTLIKGIGSSLTSSNNLPLTMDIYEPKDDNLQLNRAVIVYIHGGAFFLGDKQNSLQKIFTDLLVKKGYVVVSINYRLGFNLLQAEAGVERAIYGGVQDTRAAIRFLIQNKDKYRIDPNHIYLCGNSAGAIIALHTTYMDQSEIFNNAQAGRRNLVSFDNMKGLDNSGNSFKQPVQIAGLISLWGGVLDLHLIDKKEITPTLLIHGTSDMIVPNNKGIPYESIFGFVVPKNWRIHGSEAISKHMNKLELPVTYIPLKNYGHEPQENTDGSLNENARIIQKEVNAFLYKNTLKHLNEARIRGKASLQPGDSAPIYQLIDSGKDIQIHWRVEGGIITEESDKTIRVVWFDSEENHKIDLWLTDENGVSIQKMITVTIH